MADRVTTAEYDDIEALKAFADCVDVITYEFENIPTEALDAIEARRPIRPTRKALAVSQDRINEKSFLTDLSIPIALYAQIDCLADLTAALETIGTPAILKTRRFGYDGKGQVRITDANQAEEALEALKGAPAFLKGL